MSKDCSSGPGWRGEAGLGLAVGWAAAVACVLPLTVAGGIAVVLSTQPSAWGWLVVDAVFFALAAMVEEVGFRGGGGFPALRCRGVDRLALLSGSPLTRCFSRCIRAQGKLECRCICGTQCIAVDCVSTYARAVGELGIEPWLEGEPGAHFWSDGKRCEQPLLRC